VSNKTAAVLSRVKGSAQTYEKFGLPSADPTLDVLAARGKAIQVQERLEALETNALRELTGAVSSLITEMRAERDVSRQALVIAMEALNKVRESAPQSAEDREKMLQRLAVEAQQHSVAKQARFREMLRDAKPVRVYNSGQSTELMVNGVRIVLRHGMNDIPEPFMPAWETHLEADTIASERNALVVGGKVDYGVMEDWMYAGRPEAGSPNRPEPAQRVWDVDSGKV
jgi:hypothetical protein